MIHKSNYPACTSASWWWWQQHLTTSLLNVVTRPKYNPQQTIPGWCRVWFQYASSVVWLNSSWHLLLLYPIPHLNLESMGLRIYVSFQNRKWDNRAHLTQRFANCAELLQGLKPSSQAIVFIWNTMTCSSSMCCVYNLRKHLKWLWRNLFLNSSCYNF